MDSEEKTAAFLSDLDDLLRRGSESYDHCFIVTKKAEERIYQDGKVVAIKKSFNQQSNQQPHDNHD